MASESTTYDIVIVGGGTAGLALASRLSEDPNLTVAVAESGSDHRATGAVLTPALWPLLTVPGDPLGLKVNLDWEFTTVPQVCALPQVNDV